MVLICGDADCSRSAKSVTGCLRVVSIFVAETVAEAASAASGAARKAAAAPTASRPVPRQAVRIERDMRSPPCPVNGPSQCAARLYQKGFPVDQVEHKHYERQSSCEICGGACETSCMTLPDRQ